MIDKTLDPRSLDTAYKGAAAVESSRQWIPFGMGLLAIWRFGGRMFAKAKFSPGHGIITGAMRACAVLIVLTGGLLSCSRKDPGAGRVPDPDPEAFDLGPKTFRVHADARIYLRASVLPEEIADHPGFRRDLGVHKVEIQAFSPEEVRLSWQMKERYETRGGPREAVLKGAIRAAPWTHARRMRLPYLWEAKEERVSDAALLWLTPAAFRELKEKGKTDWGLPPEIQGKRDPALRRGKIVSRPLLVNRKERWVDVMLAEGEAGEFRILNNPENPLILSVTVRGRKEPAPLSSTGRTRLTHGYRVTEVLIRE